LIIRTLHPEQKYWLAFCEATGQTQLVNDLRYAKEETRRDHHPELVSLFDRVFATKIKDEGMEIFRSHEFLFAPVQRIHELLNDPQALLTRYGVNFDDKVLGKVKIAGYPFHFSS